MRRRAALVALCWVAVGCSGSGGSTTSPLASTSPATGLETPKDPYGPFPYSSEVQKRAFRSFLECAADHGVRYRGPFADSNGEGVLFGLAPGQEDSSADRLRVSRHCPQMLVGTFATPPPGGLEIALFEKTAVRFAKCLRAHGPPDFPLPRFSESDPFHALEQLPFHWKSQRFVDVVNDRIEPVRSYVFST